MRYFLVLLVAFGLFHLPALRDWEPLAGSANKAAVALALAIFLSGIHHAVFAGHYVDLLPPRLPAKSAQVYLSAVLRMIFGVGLLFVATRPAATIGTLVLLCLVLPVNIRVALQGNTRGQLVAAGWFLWLRLAVHASWIGWCGWCLTLSPR